MKNLLVFIKNTTITGNLLYIIWLVLNGINEGFGSILIKSFSYVFLFIVLILNSYLLIVVSDVKNNSQQGNATKGKLILISTLLLLVSAGISYLIYLKKLYPTAPPFTSISYIYESVKTPHKTMNKETVGFLPYWRMDDIKYLKFDLLSEVIFFSLTVDENGDIVKVVDGETDPGWRWWESTAVKELVAKTQISDGKFSVAVAMHKNETIEKFLDNQKAQHNLISNLAGLIKENNLDGINIDFEYAGQLSDESYRDKFTRFNSSLSSELKKEFPDIRLSIDFYPFSVQKPRLFDIPKLEPLFDKIIVMSYDYYGASSTVAGPVAPMYGYAEKNYLFDVSSTYSDYLSVIPKDKIIMGVPYYAWDYPVEDGKKPMSNVLTQNDENGYTSVMSYGRMRTNTDIKQENCVWDELAMQNWCYYKDPDTDKFRQIWLEDNRSIGIKFDFVNEKELGGIAIWTLGYDKEYPDLWDMINSKFTSKD